jgi:hypothetical protein
MAKAKGGMNMGNESNLYKIMITNDQKVYSPLMEEVEVIPGKKEIREFSTTSLEELEDKLAEQLETKGTNNLRPYIDQTQEVIVTVGAREPVAGKKKAVVTKVFKAPISMYNDDLSEGGEAYRWNQERINVGFSNTYNEYMLSYSKDSLKKSVSNGSNLKFAGEHSYFALLISFDKPANQIVGSFISKPEEGETTFMYAKLTPLTEALTENSQKIVEESYPELVKENTYIAWIPVDAIANQVNNNLAEVIYKNALTYGYYFIGEVEFAEEGSSVAPFKVCDTTIKFRVKELS